MFTHVLGPNIESASMTHFWVTGPPNTTGTFLSLSSSLSLSLSLSLFLHVLTKLYRNNGLPLLFRWREHALHRVLASSSMRRWIHGPSCSLGHKLVWKGCC